MRDDAPLLTPTCSMHRKPLRLYYKIVSIFQRHPARFMNYAAIGFTFVVFLLFYRRYDPHQCVLRPSAHPVQCLDGYLIGAAGQSGIGNVVFEMFTLLSMARLSNRSAIIRESGSAVAVNKAFDAFPKLRREFRESTDNSCGCYSSTVEFTQLCCVYDKPSIHKLLTNNDLTVRAAINYGQVHKYFDIIGKDHIMKLLEVNYSLKEFASIVFDRKPVAGETSICVHMRRGDFVGNRLVQPSFANFTEAAARYLAEKYKNPQFYVFSNNQTFANHTLTMKNVAFAKELHNPPVHEWEFSRQNCDVTLLTASASTFGWWIAYLSKGQDVYYNQDYSTPQGIFREMDENDFFPENWKPLKLDSSGSILALNRSMHEIL